MCLVVFRLRVIPDEYICSRIKVTKRVITEKGVNKVTCSLWLKPDIVFSLFIGMSLKVTAETFLRFVFTFTFFFFLILKKKDSVHEPTIRDT